MESGTEGVEEEAGGEEREEPHLGERLEERTADGLLVALAHLRDEKRAGREHKVRAEHGDDRRREAERPVRRVRVDQREQQPRDARQHRPDHYIQAHCEFKHNKGRRGGETRTGEVDKRDAANDERDEHVAQHAGDGHRQHAHHRQDRAQALEVLVVQLRTPVSRQHRPLLTTHSIEGYDAPGPRTRTP